MPNLPYPLAGFVGLLLAAMAASPGWAQQPSQAQANAIRQSCRADYQSYCAAVPPGGQASLSCLQAHSSSLSPECALAVGAVGNGGAHMGQAAPHPAAPPAPPPHSEAAMLREECAADYRTWCRMVRPGGGRALECLAAHRRELSPGCRESLVAMRAGS